MAKPIHDAAASIHSKKRTVTDIELYAIANVLGVEIKDLFE